MPIFEPPICKAPKPVIYTGNGRTIFEQIKMIHSNHKAFVLTGVDRGHFELNRGVGKTTVAGRAVIPWLESQKIPVEYFDLQKYADAYRNSNQSFFDSREFDWQIGYAIAKTTKALEGIKSGWAIVDEAQFLFGEKGFSWNMRKDQADKCWFSMGQAAKNGVKLLFVTAMHPLNPWFNNVEHFLEGRLFFKAPIFELA